MDARRAPFGHLPELGPGAVHRAGTGQTWVRKLPAATRPPSWTGSCRPACTHRHRVSVPVGIMSVVQWSTLLNARRTEPVDRAGARRRARAGCCTRSCSHHRPRPPSTDDDDEAPATELPSIPLGDALGLRRPVTARGVGTVQRILLAAADRFRVNGYYGTSLNDVAAAAGVSHGSVYTYWADRDALFATLAQDAVAAVERQRHRCPADRPTGDRSTGGSTAGCRCSTCTAACSTSGQHEVDGPGHRRAHRPDERGAGRHRRRVC